MARRRAETSAQRQRDPSTKTADDGDPGAERAVLAQLVRADRAAQWRASELLVELSELHPAAIYRAVRQLVDVGVAYQSGPFVWVTPATSYLRGLGVIAPDNADEAPRDASG